MLAGAPLDGTSQPLVEHRNVQPRPPRPTATPRRDIIAVVESSGLVGKGGAAFPTARKLAAVADGRAPRVVVVNATEGEPASAKDDLLLRSLPHLVLDGALLAAAAVGAERVVVAVDRTRGNAVRSVRRALAERSSEVAGIDVSLALTPPRYVAGEETALVHWINGGPAMPTPTPPRPFERGVDGRPTLVQNAETLAQLARIARFGAGWYREAGTDEEPGTRLVTVSGAVMTPSVVEVPIGTPVRAIVAAAGGLSAPAQAFLVGGFFGTWVAGDDALAARFSRAGLAPVGASPGAGVVVALPDAACGLAETGRILGWFAAESAGQCGPCIHGLAALAGGAAELGKGTPADLSRLRRWAGDVEGRGGCRHPDGAVRLLRSALAVFAGDVAAHEAGRPCAGAGQPGVLHVPTPPNVWR